MWGSARFAVDIPRAILYNTYGNKRERKGETKLEKPDWIAQQEAYIYVGQQKLRRGYTTGTCAAAAAQAAAMVLFGGEPPQAVRLTVPKGLELHIPVHSVQAGDGWAQASVCKDSGDDPDATDGIEVFVRLEPAKEAGIAILGGQGVGRVTKPGLEMPVGEAAINRVPRQMIRQQIELVRQDYPAWEGVGLRATVSIPQGEAVAKRTFNPRLGIEGGISVLGTSGIVEPMSEKALTDSIKLELSILRKAGHTGVLITPGNYGQAFLNSGTLEGLSALSERAVKCSNYVGDTLDMCVQQGFERVLLVGHIGKFCKLAAGIMNTHSRYADGRLEVFTAHAALCGASRETLFALMDSATTDEAIALLDREGLRQDVVQSMLQRIEEHVRARAGETLQTGVILFSNAHGFLGMTQGSEQILQRLLEEY